MNKTESVIIGMISGSVGAWFLQLASIFVFALVGAAAGWIFAEYLKPVLKPKFDKLFKKKEE